MIALRLERYDSSERGTRGVVSRNKQHVHTLELPWRMNEPNISCIPEGGYMLTPHRRGLLITGGVCVALRQQLTRPVATRWGCLIHPANYLYELHGCIAPGLIIGIGNGTWIDWNWSVGDSDGGLARLLQWTEGQPAQLIITSNPDAKR